MLKRNVFVDRKKPILKTRKRFENPFQNGKQATFAQQEIAQKKFREILQRNVREASSIDVVAREIAKEANIPHNLAYTLASRMVLTEKMKQINQQKALKTGNHSSK